MALNQICPIVKHNHTDPKAYMAAGLALCLAQGAGTHPERIVLSTKGNERVMAKANEDITAEGTALFHWELLQPPKH